MVSAPLLCGCFFSAAVPPQPIPQTPAAHDPPEKGLIRGPKPPAPANAETALADGAKPAGVRGLMLRGGWYRAPLTADDEQGAGSREQGAGSREQGAGSEQRGAGPLAANFHYRHAGLEQLMARPAEQRGVLPELLSDSDRNVVVTAAIGLARQGDAKAASYLVNAIEDAKDNDLPLPARCAAVEALGQLPGDGQTETLRKLVDRHGRFMPGAGSDYQVEMHAELLRALARHVDAADDPRFARPSRSPRRWFAWKPCGPGLREPAV